MTESLKCSIVKKDENVRVEMCWALKDSLADIYRGLGIHYVQLINTMTMKPSRGLVKVHSGKWKKGGVIFNYCPFCGENISNHLRDESND